MCNRSQFPRVTRSLLVAAATTAAISLAAATPAAAMNLLPNPSFETVGPAGSPTTNVTALPGGAGLSAADAWGVFHNTAPSTTRTDLVATTLPGASGRMIHVLTERDRNGLVAVFDAFNAGPTQAYAWAWVLAREGTAGMGTGNGGNTGFDALTTTTGEWEFLQSMNGVSPANEFIVYSKDGGADFFVDEAGVVAIQDADRDRVILEYSNQRDEQAVPGGGAHGAPDPGQVLVSAPIDTLADPYPADGLDHSPSIEEGEEPDEQVDALANGQDFGFDELTRNRIPLVVSLSMDLSVDAASMPIAVWREEPTGATGVEYLQADIDATDVDPARKALEDLDAMELWGHPELEDDAVFYSLAGDFEFSIFMNLHGSREPFVRTSTIHGALAYLGFSGQVHEVDVDALMVKDTGPALNRWDVGDELLVSIKPSANFDGGEIVHIRHNPAGAILHPPTFLRHGGHIWDTAFSVASHFQIDSENVDAMEATITEADSEDPDRDGDGVPDSEDNCPHWSNPDQTDSNGDGRGDACECGDQDGNHTVDIRDVLAINEVIFGLRDAAALCDTNEDGTCNINDILGVNRKIFGSPLYCKQFPSP